jgi:hypothetical protein
MLVIDLEIILWLAVSRLGSLLNEFEALSFSSIIAF